MGNPSRRPESDHCQVVTTMTPSWSQCACELFVEHVFNVLEISGIWHVENVPHKILTHAQKGGFKRWHQRGSFVVVILLAAEPSER